MKAEAYKVLVIDPSDAGVRLAQRLSDKGLTAQCVNSAALALDLLIADRPDVIIVEMNLPDSNAADLVLVINEEVHVPIFLASPGRLSADDDKFETLMHSVEGFLPKPYQLDLIVKRLANCLGTSLEELQRNSGAELEKSGQRWGYEDVHDSDSAINRVQRDHEGEILLLDEIVVDDSSSDAAPGIEQDLARELISAEKQNAQIAMNKQWEQKLSAYRPLAQTHIHTEFGPLAGRIEAMPVPRLFDMFYRARRSGELALVRGKAKRLIVFEKGKAVYARSNIAQERMGAVFVKRGLISAEQLRQAIEQADGKDQRVGQVLVEQNLVSEKQRREILLRVVTQVVMGSFAWIDGEYVIGLVQRARSEQLKVSLFSGNVLLRGLCLVMDDEQLHQEIPDDARFAPCADPVYPVEQLKLNDVEVRVLIASDGTKTVQDLETLYDLDFRQLRSLLFALQYMGVIELAGHGRAKPREISFF